MGIIFPASPTVGQTYTEANGTRWVWNGIQWTGIPSGSSFLPVTGGTMTGPVVNLTAPDPPTNDSSQAVPTTKWINNTLAGRQNRNRIINGGFLIDQYNNYASYLVPTGGYYVCDRWMVGVTQASKIYTLAGDFNSRGNEIALQSASAYTPLTTDYCYLAQSVEGFNIADFEWGTPNAKPVTLSFRVITSVAGTYSGRISNVNLSYIFTFTLPALVLTQVVISIPPITTGTWAVDSTMGLYVGFDLGSGANWRITPGAWTAGNYLGASGSVSLIATNNATMQFSNIQLELGTQATPFDWRSYGEELMLCQRYYQVLDQFVLAGYSYGGGPMYMCGVLPTTMRVLPTGFVKTISGVNNCFNLTMATTDNTSFFLSALVSGTGVASLQAGLTFNAEL